MNSLTDTLIQLINKIRSDHNLIPLGLNTKLSDAADLHAAYMLQVSILSHTGRKSSSFGDRINSENYQFIFAGENVAFGAPTAQDALDLWMKSPPHCANILSPDYRELGAGVAPITIHNKNDKNRYWSLTLASPLQRELKIP